MGLKYPHDLCVIPGDNDSDSVTWNILTFEVASEIVRSLIILHDRDLEAVVPLAMKLYRFLVRLVQAWKFDLQTSLWNDNPCYLWTVEALVDCEYFKLVVLLFRFSGGSERQFTHPQ